MNRKGTGTWQTERKGVHGGHSHNAPRWHTKSFRSWMPSWCNWQAMAPPKLIPKHFLSFCWSGGGGGAHLDMLG